MKRKQYEKPMMEAFCQLEQAEPLAGSGNEVTATISDFVEEEWDPTPTSRGMDFTDIFDNSTY